MRHDQRRGAGDGDEADLEVGFFQRALVLRHGLQARHRQHAGDRGHGRALADRAQEQAALLVVREQRFHERGFDELIAIGLELGGLAAAAQLDGRAVGRDLGVVVGHGVVAPAAALHHERAIGVVGIEEFGHGAPRELMTGCALQATGQNACQAGPMAGPCRISQTPHRPRVGPALHARPFQGVLGARAWRSAYSASSTSFLVPVFSRMRAR